MDGRCGEDLRETKVKIWQQKAVDREEWASIIKEGRTEEE